MRSTVQVRGLRKEYKDLVAVKGLNLDLDSGDIFGFIGPNGAGKTTTIKMLATLLTPTEGTATVAGVDVIKFPEQARSVVGYMPDFFGVYDDIKVWEYLDFFAAAYRIPSYRRQEVINNVLTLTDLGAKRDSYVESLSRGMKQRLCLAKTLVNEPKVLLLDEPASGLDPRARIEIRDLLKKLGAMGTTIIVSSHILPELAEFCNKIGIIEKGEMLVTGQVDDIIRELRQRHTLEIRVRSDDRDEAKRLLDSRTDLTNITDGSSGGLLADYGGEPDGEWQVLNALVAGGVRVLSFGTQATDLEDVFMRVTRGIAS